MTETNKPNVIPEIKKNRHSGNFESSRNYPESQVTKNEIPAFAGMTEKKLEWRNMNGTSFRPTGEIS
jgi:hypothetical protein